MSSPNANYADAPPHAGSDVQLSVLVVDDEAAIRKTIRRCLEDEGHDVTEASSARDARRAASSELFDLTFLDQRLGGVSGIDIIPDLLAELPNLQIVMITAYASVETAVEAVKQGAADYLAKPFSPAQVRMAAQKAKDVKALEAKVAALETDLEQARPQVQPGSKNREMQETLATARQVAGTDATVLLRGESGTGKGVLARSLHAWSARRDRPFVVVHAPSLPRELFESELFGHVKGAFTGATRTNKGRIGHADGGTLFLDEIGDLPMGVQPKLLRFIQDREYERIGDPTPRKADVRLLAATNQDLSQAVSEGRFREDLLYRLNVIEITIPPLRQRPEDVLPLARQFLAFFADKYNKPIEEFGEKAANMLQTHRWPGNVRELRNAIERAVILSQGRRVTAGLLPLQRKASTEPAREVGQRVTLEELEVAHIRRIIALSETMEEAAETLGIDSTTLWRKRRKYGL